MEKISLLLNALYEKYGNSNCWFQRIRNKYVISPVETEVFESLPKSEPVIIFTQNEKENRNTLNKFEKLFVEQIWNRVYNNESKQTELKIIKKYLEEIRKLQRDKKIDFIDAGRLAEKIKKIIEKTLLKLWNNDFYRILIQDYLSNNGIRFQYFDENHTLTDEEFESLDGKVIEAYIENTIDKSMQYKVIETIQPIMKIYYMDDDDEKEYAEIAGVCRFYRYVE